MWRFLILCLLPGVLLGKVSLGVDELFDKDVYSRHLKGKRLALLMNATSINSEFKPSLHLFREKQAEHDFKIQVIFAPEHGYYGMEGVWRELEDFKDLDGVTVHSLIGSKRRPSEEMLKGVDLIVCDLQDSGSRSYTYLATLCYVMEAAAKQKIPVMILDRPNPIGGIAVDGPMLDDSLRSIVGYLNIPYCHGMTFAELAKFFNSEYRVGCDLKIVPMKKWRRSMRFSETGLLWIPPSPYMADADTPLYYPITGLLGEMQHVSIGIGHTQPFQVVGAPWIHAQQFADALNDQNFPGVSFVPYHFKPFYGRFEGEHCRGVKVVVTDSNKFEPINTAYLLFGILKALYPFRFKEGMEKLVKHEEMFEKLMGTKKLLPLMKEQRYLTWALKDFQKKERLAFKVKRQRYLLY